MTAVGEFQNRIAAVEADIVVATSATLSNKIDLCGSTLVALQTPAALTSTAVKFNCSYDGTTYQTMYKGGSDYSVTVAALKYIVLAADDFVGIRWIQLVMGSSEGADRAIQLVTRPIY